MSELKVFTFGLGRYTEDGYPCVVAVDGEGNSRLAYDEEFYLKSEADKVIAELKQKLENSGMRERKLRRLLWHAIALFCARSCEYFSGIMSHCLMGQDVLYKICEEKKNKYLNAMYKCRAKTEKFGEGK